MEAEAVEDSLEEEGPAVPFLLMGFPQGFLTGCIMYLSHYSLMIGHWKIALGMAGMWDRITNELKIPVIDPAPVAIKYAEMLAGLGICYSRKAYPSPPDKEII